VPFVWGHAGLVAIGGTLGAALRAALLLIEAPAWQVYAVPVINVVGAFLLGVVTGYAMRFASTARATRFRLFLGAGATGGFTTYSTFAVQAVSVDTVWITLATIVVGTLAGWIGLLAARPRSARPRSARPSNPGPSDPGPRRADG